MFHHNLRPLTSFEHNRHHFTKPEAIILKAAHLPQSSSSTDPLPPCRPKLTKEKGVHNAPHARTETHNHSRQNNDMLGELGNKVSALRNVTVDIYDNARNHEMLDANVRLSTTDFESFRAFS
jgi:hypothetical protein